MEKPLSAYHESYKAISIREPFAGMIADGLKTIETRKWSTKFRGRLVICSSKSKKISGSGSAIATVELVDCRPMRPNDWSAAQCDPYPRAFAWVLCNPLRFEHPFPVRGKLGLFDIGQAIEDYRKTSDATIKSFIRKLWMQSRERTAAIRDQGHKCRRCNARETSRKGIEVSIEVHHRKGEIDWEKIISFIRQEVLVDPSLLDVMCMTCHDLEHGKTRKGRGSHEGMPITLSAKNENCNG